MLEWQKEKWRVILEEEGKRVFGEDYELESTDVNYSFVNIGNRRKVLHSLKYQYRQWVVDFCDWSEETEYTGEIPEEMRRYNHRARAFGFWKKLVMEGEMEEELKELESGKKKICPFCGAMTNKIGEESTEEIWRKVKESEIEWYEFNKGKLKKARHPSELFFSYLCLPEGECEAPSMLPEYEELPTRGQRLVDDMSEDKELLARLLAIVADIEPEEVFPFEGEDRS